MYALRLWIVLISGIVPTAMAATYSNALKRDNWRLVSTVFECRLEQQIPLFGDAVIRTRAGEQSGFYLRAKTARFEAGDAQLVAKAPVWIMAPQQDELGLIPVKRGTRPLWLNSNYAELILSKLNGGMEILLIKDSWYELPDSAPDRLSITPIGFREAYQKYLKCLGGLLPKNFDQVKRTALYFPPGDNDALDNRMIRKLEQILALTKHDKRIRHFYIDGHTDSNGSRADNLALSQRRAELVQQYLVGRGIPESWIVLRWHGERYPVASNASVAGRAKNRRVTVRLEKQKELEKLPLAAN